MFRLSGLVLVVAAGFLAVGVAHAQTLTTLASFNGSNGDEPVGGLTLSGNILYGTTEVGGASGYGSVFSLPVSGGSPTVLASFNGSNGRLPYAGLTLSADGSTLYGTTSEGGNLSLYSGYGAGTVFSIPVGGGSPTVLASFNASNGAFPEAGVTLSGSTLYGTTLLGGNLLYGGGNGAGAVFSVPVSGGSPTVLASFTNSNGNNPYCGLTLSGGTLYGTCDINSTIAGAVFSVPASGGSPTVLASLTGIDGQNPYAGLTLSGGTLYGTTGGYGSNNGTVFSVPVNGGSPTALTTFNGSDGSDPCGGLTLSGNTLHGTTRNGGANGDGTVFSIPVSGGSPTVLASFNGSNGQYPLYGNLTLVGSTLYGETLEGGAYGDGTVFALTVPEPSVLVLVGIGAISLLAFAWRRRRVK